MNHSNFDKVNLDNCLHPLSGYVVGAGLTPGKWKGEIKMFAKVNTEFKFGWKSFNCKLWIV